MFGTRAGLVVDLSFCVSALAPLLVLASLRLARAGRHEAHRRLQLTLLAVCVGAVLALEARIRLAGGSGALLQAERLAHPRLARVVLGLHITGAVLTYATWGWLAVASGRRFRVALPGPFSARHRAVGQGIFAGLCFTAASAAAVYALAFLA